VIVVVVGKQLLIAYVCIHMYVEISSVGRIPINWKWKGKNVDIGTILLFGGDGFSKTTYISRYPPQRNESSIWNDIRGLETNPIE